MIVYLLLDPTDGSIWEDVVYTSLKAAEAEADKHARSIDGLPRPLIHELTVI